MRQFEGEGAELRSENITSIEGVSNGG